ncbi:MAG: 3-phosphoshikimate 1-carboxyvinyltransferase [Patescibacteria group bacterium]|nr:3-phosphoshikimate 1-carboxyvinyltransferase [Patescibacteria group bacterium]
MIRSITPIGKPVTSRVAVPGSKSYTNRALCMAALAGQPVTLHNPLASDDTEAMITCLRKLGYEIQQSDKKITVQAGNSKRAEFRELYCRDSGTTIRFLTALSATLTGTTRLTGSPRLTERPLMPLVEGLRQLGAEIAVTGNRAPITITRPAHGGICRVTGGISSQFFSALLMAAPALGAVTIEVEGELISRPYAEMTLDMMRDWGVNVSTEAYHRFHVPEASRYTIREYTIEGDYSSAGYFFALAALTGSTITVENLKGDSKQADRRFPELLRKLGATVTFGTDSVTVTGGTLHPVTVSLESCPDQAQTMAVLAAFAPGTSVLAGVRSLRLKETERVAALQNELGSMGIRTEATEDVLIIHGGKPKPALIKTYNDHRMAMSFAVAGARLAGMRIADPHVVAKTFPSFWEVLAEAGITSSEQES